VVVMGVVVVVVTGVVVVVVTVFVPQPITSIEQINKMLTRILIFLINIL
jgi:Tfp pilus assembly protein PilN